VIRRMTSQMTSCYLAAPHGANLSTILDVLRERGIQVESRVPETRAAPLGHHLDELIIRADFVVGVITTERQSDWVLFELGHALAKRKKILLFAPPNAMPVPPYLQGFLVVRAALSNADAIAFAIDQFLAAPSQTTPTADFQPDGRQRPAASDYRRLAQVTTRQSFGSELEKVVADAIRHSGVDVVVEKSGPGARFDLAVWSDEFQTILGNPLIVEIRGSFRLSDARMLFSKFSRAIKMSSATFGLLVYQDFSSSRQEPTLLAPPNVLVISVRALLDGLTKMSFAELVRDLVKRRVERASK
jgi:hypothetical protein